MFRICSRIKNVYAFYRNDGSLYDCLLDSMARVLSVDDKAVDLETSNGLMSAAGKLMMLSRLLIVPGVEHAMRNIGVNLCLLVLMARGS